MAIWFLRGLRRGVVTTRYPARPDKSAADLPTPPQFLADRIPGELAVRLTAVCPSRALHREGNMLVYDVGSCTCCGRCEQIAPAVLRPSGQFELAVTVRSHLTKRIGLTGETGS